MDNEKQISLCRTELKYFIRYIDYLKIKEILANFLKVDSYSALKKGYWIRSLYFDTPDNKEYIEKILGVENRKKIRLRLYNLEDQTIKLEIKNKYNNYMKKETAHINREDALKLIKGEKDFLLESRNTILNKVYYFMSEKYYMPVVIVDYFRDAFVGNFNNIRITFDHDISACVTELNMFRGDLHLFPVFDNTTIVMEVKYNCFLPTWLKMVLSCIRTVNSAISKYCFSREACLMNI
ncbi:MAG: polyphosphate polymerase domain-containing protein [Spirochaetales bacterium]|nr:polyphosphate polymerase domain-containing protein [Spirochaetales bacterium]